MELIIQRIEAHPNIFDCVTHCWVISLGHKIWPFLMFYRVLCKNEVGDPPFLFHKIISHTILYHYGKFQSNVMDFGFCIPISLSKNESFFTKSGIFVQKFSKLKQHSTYSCLLSTEYLLWWFYLIFRLILQIFFVLLMEIIK